jgi:signal transduction histidine kinase
MVQEGLTNITKYAQATEASIVMKNYGNHVVVEVTDNGKGFDPHRGRPSTHGLQGMRHRVEAAKGKLTIASKPGEGTRLRAVLPSSPTR